MFERHPIQLILYASQIVKLPLSDIIKILHLFCLRLDALLQVMPVRRVRAIAVSARTSLAAQVVIFIIHKFDQIIGAVLDVVQASRVAGDERPNYGD